MTTSRKTMLDRCEACGHPRHEHDTEIGCCWIFGHNGAITHCGCKPFAFTPPPGLLHRFIHWLMYLAMDGDPCWICGRET